MHLPLPLEALRFFNQSATRAALCGGYYLVVCSCVVRSLQLGDTRVASTLKKLERIVAACPQAVGFRKQC